MERNIVGNTGAACPGLIEAGARSGRSARPRRIPGQPAPASLKQDFALRAAGRIQPNTGAACPGLIEAATAVQKLADGDLEYRGSLPRPH